MEKLESHLRKNAKFSNKEMNINYLKHSEIDKLKWDKCINQSINGIVYAYSWFLDIVSYQWEALIVGDYEIVMPLTVKKKYGINYIFQPLYTQQLGIFSIQILTKEIVHHFLDAIPNKYKIIDINLNTHNKIDTKNLRIKQGVTYQIDLIGNYKSISKNFNTNTKRNINKALKNKIQVSKHINLKDLLMLKKQTAKNTINFEHLNIFRRIIPFSITHNIGETYGAYSSNNELIAAAYFIKSNYKAVYLLSVSNEEGKEKGGMFAIINQFIKDHSGKNITLDFEGSKIESIARFFKGFGGKPIYFYRIIMNRLPWFLKFFY